MLRNAIWLFIIAVFILGVFIPSYTKLQDIKAKNDAYDARIADLKRQKAELEHEKNLLETDPAYLEKVAREKMGLIREGEVIYKITPADGQK